MTTKSKTRKAPAKPAAPAGSKRRPQTRVALEVVEADHEDRSDLAKTENESEKLIAIHNDEQKSIDQLATLVPESFDDAYCLLKFATGRAEQGGCMVANAEIDMLKHALAGLPPARHDELEA